MGRVYPVQAACSMSTVPKPFRVILALSVPQHFLSPFRTVLQVCRPATRYIALCYCDRRYRWHFCSVTVPVPPTRRRVQCVLLSTHAHQECWRIVEVLMLPAEALVIPRLDCKIRDPRRPALKDCMARVTTFSKVSKICIFGLS